MRFYTKQECEDWLAGKERTKPDEVPGLAVETIWYPREPYRMYYFAH
jgi:hypothetical protein